MTSGYSGLAMWSEAALACCVIWKWIHQFYFDTLNDKNNLILRCLGKHLFKKRRKCCFIHTFLNTSNFDVDQISNCKETHQNLITKSNFWKIENKKSTSNCFQMTIFGQLCVNKMRQKVAIKAMAFTNVLFISTWVLVLSVPPQLPKYWYWNFLLEWKYNLWYRVYPSVPYIAGIIAQ